MFRPEEFKAEPWSNDVEFRRELMLLINKYSRENFSNTPDFMLAEYLIDCLEVYEKLTQKREAWYGRTPKPCENPPESPFEVPKTSIESPKDYYEL